MNALHVMHSRFGCQATNATSKQPKIPPPLLSSIIPSFIPLHLHFHLVSASLRRPVVEPEDVRISRIHLNRAYQVALRTAMMINTRGRFAVIQPEMPRTQANAEIFHVTKRGPPLADPPGTSSGLYN